MSKPPFLLPGHRAQQPAQPTPFQQANATARLQAAVALHQRGDLDGASAIYRDILRVAPNHFDARQLLATVALQKGDLATAIPEFQKALKLNPAHVGTLSNYGAALLGAGRPADALGAFDNAIRQSPNYAEAHNNRGEALRALGRRDEALAAFVRAAQLKPNYVDAVSNCGALLTAVGRHAEALGVLESVVQARADTPEVWCNIASAQRGLRRNEDAIASYRKALAQQPGHLRGVVNLAALLMDLARADEALELIDTARRNGLDGPQLHAARCNALLALDQTDAALADVDAGLARHPGDQHLLLARADILSALGRNVEALTHYDALVKAAPSVGAHAGRAKRLRSLRRPEEAAQAFEAAAAQGELTATAHYERAGVMVDLGRFADALASIDMALAMSPGQALIHGRRGAILAMLKRNQEALEELDKALALNPTLEEPQSNRATMLFEAGHYRESAKQLAKMRAQSARSDFLPGRLWHARQRTCDWSEFHELRAEILAGLEQGKRVAMPFQALLLPHLKAQAAAARIFSDLKYSAEPDALPARPAENRPLRVGYFSADYRNHPVMALMGGVFEGHDRARVEPFAFGFGNPTHDFMRARAEAAFGRIVDIGKLDPRTALALARDAQLDIAVDLTGHTGDGRPELFARRVAPIQVNFLGFTGTMGMTTYDYLIADEVCIPASLRDGYAEKIVWMPDCYQPNDRNRPRAAPGFTREQCGLPEDAFVFCCFNISNKFDPNVFALWVEILRRVDGSVLWVFVENDHTAESLRRTFADTGLEPHRLVFSRRTPRLEDHFSRYLLADLFLDTFPYNAHTTASDALWSGVPVVTRMGEPFAARVAASLLTTLGLSELITETPDAYVDLAVALAHDRQRLADIRKRLIAVRETSPLFDTERFTRNLERVYEALHARAVAGLPPDHIERLEP